MGCFPSRRRKHLVPASDPPPATWLFKARTKTQQMLVYDTSQGTVWEVQIATEGKFQMGQVMCVWAAGILFFVGGVEDGLVALKVDMSQSTSSKVLSPPIPLAYGFMHRRTDRMFLLGALTLSPNGKLDQIASAMSYNPYLNKWEDLPEAPESVALAGSFILGDSLYLLGGFLSFPTNPVPSSKVMRFLILENRWIMLDIDSPIQTALPTCAPISDYTILVIGGFDPMEDLGESLSVYLFEDGKFQELESLPDIGEKRFCDSPFLSHGTVYLISEDETLFTFNTVSATWTGLDLVEKLRKSVIGEERISHPFRSSSGYLLHYLESECAWLEYNLEDQSVQKIEPRVFRSYVKHPGLLTLRDGRLMLAGGLKQTRDSREAVNSVWVFDSVTKNSVDLMILPKKQYGLKLVSVMEDVYALAGIVENEGGGRCQVYSASAKEWKPLPEMPYPTQFPGVCVFNGNIYAIAGCAVVAEGAEAFNLIQVYNPDSSLWHIRTTEYPQGVKHIALTNLDNASILCVGGVYANNEACHSVYLFNAKDFVELEPLPIINSSKGACHFRDPVVRQEQEMFFCSLNGYVYIYDILARGWHIREVLVSNRM